MKTSNWRNLLLSLGLCLVIQTAHAFDLPIGLEQVRNHQAALVNTITAALYPTPYQWMTTQPLVTTNFSVPSGLSAAEISTRLQAAAHTLGVQAVNYATPGDGVINRFRIVVTASMENVPVSYANMASSAGAPLGRFEIAQINTDLVGTNGLSDLAQIPDTSTVPVYFCRYIYAYLPEAKWLTIWPPPNWLVRYRYANADAVQAYTNGPTDIGAVAHSSTGYVFDQTAITSGDYGQYVGNNTNAIMITGRDYALIPIALLTGNTLGTLVVQTTNTPTVAWSLSTGKQLGTPTLTTVGSSIFISGVPGNGAMVESSTNLFGGVWTADSGVLTLPASGMLTYTPSISTPGGARFFRVRTWP